MMACWHVSGAAVVRGAINCCRGFGLNQGIELVSIPIEGAGSIWRIDMGIQFFLILQPQICLLQSARVSFPSYAPGLL